MGLLVDCPLGAEIPDVPIDDCPESLGQIQKVILQRVSSAAGAKNEFVILTADPATLASWTPLLAAADGTKVVQSPYIQGPENEPGAARTFGGGNETLGGLEIIIGREPSSFTGNILQTAQKTILALKKYQGENVAVYLVDEHGRIAGIVDDHDTPTKFSGFPIATLFVGDKKLGGLEGIDGNVISWKFFASWSDMLHIITPTDFNALTDLATP